MDWLTREIMTGFQKILCLGLDRTPATDLIEGTVLTWREVVLQGRSFEEHLDADRFRRAFVVLAGTRTSWPAPIDFLTVLPERDQLQLARESRKADPERAAAACAEIARELNIDTPREPDRKTAAAGPDA